MSIELHSTNADRDEIVISIPAHAAELIHHMLTVGEQPEAERLKVTPRQLADVSLGGQTSAELHQALTDGAAELARKKALDAARWA